MRSFLALALLVAACGRTDPHRVTVDVRPWIAALGSDDLEESDAATEKLVALGPAALETLAAALHREPPGVRRGAVEALLRLRLPDARIRLYALHALGGVGDERAVPVLAALLRDPDPAVRLRGLGKIASRGLPAAERAGAAYTGDRPQGLLPKPGP